jgi:nitrile hydratase
MNGIHDLGGMHGFGKISHTPDEPVFRSEWEGRVCAMFLSVSGAGYMNIDEWRHAMERMDPVQYLSVSYYEHWLHGMETLLYEKGIIAVADLEAKISQIKGSEARHRSEAIADRREQSGPTVLTSDMVAGALKVGKTSRVDVPVEARFKVGQRVRARNLHPLGHTRLTRYVRGKVGIVEADYGVFTLPDTMAHGNIPTPQHVYRVSFTAHELWGPEANPKNSYRVGLWDDYLDPGSEEAPS